VAVPKRSNSSSIVSIATINSAISHTLAKKGRVRGGADKNSKVLRFVVYLLLDKLAGSPDQKWFNILWLLEEGK
jgi:hypothetical protein